MGSRFAEARRNDPRVIEAVLAGERSDAPRPRWRPEAISWSIAEEQRATLIDRLGQALTLLADLPTGVKKRSKPPRPYPRPRDPIAAAREKARESFFADIEADVREAQARWERMQQEQGQQPTEGGAEGSA